MIRPTKIKIIIVVDKFLDLRALFNLLYRGENKKANKTPVKIDIKIGFINKNERSSKTARITVEAIFL